MDVTLVAYLLGTGRILIGLAALFAVDPVARWFGFPREHLTPTMRLFSRLFANRDIGLGVVLFAAAGNLPMLRLALLFNAAHDVLDFGAIAVPLIRRQGIQRPALICLACATSGIVLFGSAWWFS